MGMHEHHLRILRATDAFLATIQDPDGNEATLSDLVAALHWSAGVHAQVHAHQAGLRPLGHHVEIDDFGTVNAVWLESDSRWEVDVLRLYDGDLVKDLTSELAQLNARAEERREEEARRHIEEQKRYQEAYSSLTPEQREALRLR